MAIYHSSYLLVYTCGYSRTVQILLQGDTTGLPFHTSKVPRQACSSPRLTSGETVYLVLSSEHKASSFSSFNIGAMGVVAEAVVVPPDDRRTPFARMVVDKPADRRTLVDKPADTARSVLRYTIVLVPACPSDTLHNSTESRTRPNYPIASRRYGHQKPPPERVGKTSRTRSRSDA
jgi:hypothetical protein